MSVPESRSVPPGRSCLYECRVMHQRFAPRRHRLEHGIFMLALDLDELEGLSRRLRLFGHNRRNLYEFRDSDHLVSGAASTGLKAQLGHWLAQQGTVLPDDARVLLLTLPRVLGYIFAPVSFYFCHAADGTPLCAVAEVQNTFGELKPYRVPALPEAADPGGGRFRVVVPKEFYVSPFSDLELCFDFQLRTPGEQLALSVNDVSGDQTVLVSTLTGRRRPLTDGALVRMTLRYPLVTLRVITLIHWHALRLWAKRIPWHRKAANAGLQRGVYRPHGSLRTDPTAYSPQPTPPGA